MTLDYEKLFILFDSFVIVVAVVALDDDHSNLK